MKINDINNISSPLKPNWNINRQNKENLLNRKKALAAYLKIHKRWVLAVLILLITGVVIWYQSDSDKRVTEARSQINIDNKDAANRSAKILNKTGQKNTNRNSVARDKDSAQQISTSKIR